MKPILYLAPIRGITERTYRNVFPKYFRGFDLAVSPFIGTSRNNKLKGSLLKEFEPAANFGIKTVPQILGNSAEDFITIANDLHELGYSSVNWNLGCPFPTVINRGRGSGMLPYPEKIGSFLDSVLPEIKPQLSVKLRLGLRDSDEILKVIPVLNSYPLEEIMIHPRTGSQMYDGEVDLDSFERCLELCSHSIVYNGDIDSVETWEILSGRFNNINKWMIGRGALRNPFLPEEIKFGCSLTETEKLLRMRHFHDSLFKEYSKILSGPKHLTDRMKAVWEYLSCSFENSRKVFKMIKKAQNSEHYTDVVDKIFKG